MLDRLVIPIIIVICLFIQRRRIGVIIIDVRCYKVINMYEYLKTVFTWYPEQARNIIICLIISFFVSILVFVCRVFFAPKNLLIKDKAIMLMEHLYFVALFMLTLGCRNPSVEYRAILTPNFRISSFSSLIDILENIVLFIPLGYFAVNWFKSNAVRKSVVLGLVMTLIIELLQFVFKLGYFEVNDIIFNTLGAVLGVLLVMFIKLFKRKRMCVKLIR